jgi:hypothetical protein
VENNKKNISKKQVRFYIQNTFFTQINPKGALQIQTYSILARKFKKAAPRGSDQFSFAWILSAFQASRMTQD